MIEPGSAYEAIDSLWRKHGGMGIILHGHDFLNDRRTIDDFSRAIVARVDPLAIAMQDVELARQYVDVPGDAFLTDDGNLLEIIESNQESLGPIIDARLPQLDGLDAAENVYTVGKRQKINEISVHYEIVAWRSLATQRDHCATGFWVSHGGPQPSVVRMYPKPLPRHLAPLEALL